jgi:type VI secretion system protein ImpJ
MSWYSKVVWSEGLFLRPHHLQQSDRYLENLVESRVRHVTPYPWGFSRIEIDRDLAQQGKFSLRAAAGVMPDGTPFSMPGDCPLPDPVDVPEAAAKQVLWLTLPVAQPNTQEVEERAAESASRFVSGVETLIDATSALRVEEEIDVAHPRLALDLRKTAKPGYVSLGIARVQEVATRPSSSTRSTCPRSSPARPTLRWTAGSTG